MSINKLSSNREGTMEMTSKIGAKHERLGRPETFTEFVRVNAIEAIQELFEPFVWLRSFLLFINQSQRKLGLARRFARLKRGLRNC